MNLLKLSLIFFMFCSVGFSTESSPTQKTTSNTLIYSSNTETWTNRERELKSLAMKCDQRNLELQKQINQSIQNKRDRIGFWDARELGFFTLGVTAYAVGGFPLAGGSLIAVSVLDFISGFTLWGFGQ
jgi:hypothetical protein